MRKLWLYGCLIIISTSLASCSTYLFSQGPDVAPAEPSVPEHVIQGDVTTASTGETVTPDQAHPMEAKNDLAAASFGGMSSADRNRLTHALDAAPGKATRWTNVNTGVSYTVTPVRKVVVNNNHLCRTYTSTATRNGQTQAFNGTACITDDGNWHNVSGG